MRTDYLRAGTLAIVSGILFILAVVSPAAHAQTQVSAAEPAPLTAKAAKRQINLAGRQGMLSQKIAALVCLSELGRQSDAKGLEVLQLRWVFRRTLSAFKGGDPILGIAQETHAESVRQIQAIEAHWKLKADSMDNWALFFSSAVPEIYDLSLKVLTGTEGLVRGMKQTYINSKLVTSATLTGLTIAGRQRMLSQRMTKEFCMVHSDYKPEENRAKLNDTLQEFATGLVDLKNGSKDLGLEKPPSMIVDQLDLVEREFSLLKATLGKALSGETITKSDLDLVEQQGTKVLLAADELVYVYEQLN
ncbi:MAG: type IV pili methyl-accepting chemotaxis transducer N-terminal domain-containing protein [Pseudomonadota bacterium]